MDWNCMELFGKAIVSLFLAAVITALILIIIFHADDND